MLSLDAGLVLRIEICYDKVSILQCLFQFIDPLILGNFLKIPLILSLFDCLLMLISFFFILLYLLLHNSIFPLGISLLSLQFTDLRILLLKLSQHLYYLIFLQFVLLLQFLQFPLLFFLNNLSQFGCKAPFQSRFQCGVLFHKFLVHFSHVMPQKHSFDLFVLVHEIILLIAHLVS